ncbi:DEAD/DEAH box helicase [Nonomuraea sp. NPDC049421]|uniref:DEAD/DEAH box helicase n=1 Tax=Nonomuraea sp. NPDC049421 TaxID=3155275 RepID=UPI0034471858
MDPLKTSALITNTYRRYLRSILPVRDTKIAQALATEITSSPTLTKGPLLEATPPYQPGATLQQLIEENVLSPAFEKLGGPALPLDRPLYLHQEQAIRKATSGRNLVVATGTGSGKTESFLLPILNTLVAEHEKGELTPGVRALLLYPMNALANDQLKRLRLLLAQTPFITFGRYTGDTKERRHEGLAQFEELNDGHHRLPNELLSREEMRATPPHILLTNYAMLEYLLLRPADMELFEGEHGGRWKFIALDEAHVYDGAKAEELGMLLRRLHDRVAPQQRLQCIATSATVGDEPQAVMDFATKLFNVPFEWTENDAKRRDLVSATRISMPTGPFWGPLSAQDYKELARSDDPADDLFWRAGQQYADASAALTHEHAMARFRGTLATGPRSFDDLAELIFGGQDDPAGGLAAMVDVGSRVHDATGAPVLSARYHLFARATEGAYTCLTAGGPHVSLNRHESCPQCAGAMFEMAGCKRCGAVHLIGAIVLSSGGQIFTPRGGNDGVRTWLLLDDAPEVTDEDEVTLEEAATTESQTAFLCPRCGALHTQPQLSCGKDGCTETALRPVRKLKTKAASPSGCLVCGGRGSELIRQFESGNDAATAVLATALYQQIPPAPDIEIADHPGEGRKLLTFNDNRQAAAFFAPYLEASYGDVQHRRLILQGLHRATEENQNVSIKTLIFHVSQAAEKAGVFPAKDDAPTRQREVSLWVMRELLALDERKSLEGLGLIRVGLDRDPGWRLPPPLLSLGLSEAECWDLLEELIRSVRNQGVLTMPTDVDARDEAFKPRTGPIYVRRDGAEAKLKVLSWLPTRGRNRRLDYLTRLLAVLGSNADPKAVLEGCWKFLTNQKNGWLPSDNPRRVGIVHQVDYSRIRLSEADVSYRCELCRRFTSVSVRGVCPMMGCEGRLIEAKADPDEHYTALYQSMTPIPLTAREHTAQWTGEEAAKIQQHFLRGEVNVLSCSTTFELGVDVGELQTVMLRNMPPTTANYIQRAGRAGRRAASAALVLTYAQRRSHDLSRYQQPEAMIAGQVRAPYVPLGNERIDRRHAHSVALGAFFRYAKSTSGAVWRTAGEFFRPGGEQDAPCDRVLHFLSPVPAEITATLRQVLPTEVRAEIGVESGSWVIDLCEHLEKVRQELNQDITIFEQKIQEAVASKRYNLADRYQRTINTLTTRNLIGFLANRNVLPKYGFPVDTVELRTLHCDNPVGSKLELARDLSSAIYEYAPGSEVVAGGVLWRSAGVYRLPGRELISKRYYVCRNCQHFRHVEDDPDPICPACKTISDSPVRQYCIPEFGFVAEPRTSKPSTSPPRTSWNGATLVVKLADDPALFRWRTATGVVVQCRSGARGEMIALSEGPIGSGYVICEWCGWASAHLGRLPKSHTSPLRQGECTGPLQWRTLAHKYETDILEIRFEGLSQPREDWLSTLYALLEGAAHGLEIGRDDIDGTVHAGADGHTSLVIYDNVPGGAGSVLRIAQRLDIVAETALQRMSTCECGEETSCYGCLRNRRNERNHELLSRGAALNVLRILSGDGRLRAE